MGIETANRLLRFRKKFGFTQEELAEKISVTKVDICNWECDEASPDADSLIKLSKLYGVSVDELISCDNGPKVNNETYFEHEEGKDSISFKNGIHIHAKNGDKVDIGLGGVHVHANNGDKVDVGWNGVYVEEKGEQKVYTDDSCKVIVNGDCGKKENKIFYKMPVVPLIIVVYLCFGLLDICGGWAAGWLVFLAIPLYYSLVDAIYKHKPNNFAYPVLVAAVYLYLGMFRMMWHPYWILFLTIPLYYCIVDIFSNIKKSK